VLTIKNDRREVKFYRTLDGRCPVADYLDELSSKQVEKVLWTLRAVRTLHPVPAQYLQKMTATNDLWEVRVTLAGNIFRLLDFYDKARALVLSHGFTKKTQKTPPREIKTAERRKHDYENR
jgi:phage-related protein